MLLLYNFKHISILFLTPFSHLLYTFFYFPLEVKKILVPYQKLGRP